MESVTVRFTTHWPYNPTSPIIARLSGSKQWSHCMIVIEGMAYEATMLHGCRVVPVEEAMKGVAVYQEMYVPVRSLELAMIWGLAQKGKGYDWAGAIGLPFLASEDWADDSRWWCSEHNFMMLMQGGTTLLDANEVKRVTPNDLHQCNFPKSEVVKLR